MAPASATWLVLVGNLRNSKHLGKHPPHLSSVARPCARRVLAQKPVCASAAERNWSVYGMIKQVIKTSARGPVAWGTPLSTTMSTVPQGARALHMQSQAELGSCRADSELHPSGG